MNRPLWIPDAKRVERSQMLDFSNFVGREIGCDLSDYASLHQWSIEHLEAFWTTYLRYSEINHEGSTDPVLVGSKMPGYRWFPEFRLSFVENILAAASDGLAIISLTEDRAAGATLRSKLTFGELRGRVAACAEALKNHGVTEGDRVAGYVANVPEAVIAALACASIGAIWSSASPDFGLRALGDRLSQVEPKVLFASSHYFYNGRRHETKNVVDQIKGVVPSIDLIVTVPYPVVSVEKVGDAVWDEFLGSTQKEMTYSPRPFDHPLYILFSSGTTGRPKCLVHGAGGTLIQHKKEMQLHCDLRAGDRLFYFTTCGWMMWNWQLSALSLGATIVLYDGSPTFPDLSAIWKVVENFRVTHFGTSGRFLETCMKANPPLRRRDMGQLDSLKTLLYTGSPLSETGFRWVYDTLQKDLHLAGISGGTDIVSCFVLGNPTLPVYAGEMQCKGLGVDVVALDEEGRVLVGEPGELVCRKPLPSMPLCFLNDPAGEGYQDAYFNEFVGFWRHGDYVEFKRHGGVVIYGRSDATLNPGGVRIGSAEIYAALDELSEVKGAVVVGWKPPNEVDEIIVLFVALEPKASLDREEKSKIRSQIRSGCSPRHVPRHIFRVSEIPITRSGKTVELSVKAILAGRSVRNRDALANPDVLEEFRLVRNELVGTYT